ncbi:acyl-CoA synthetase (AMP-forming)/AMP-acid ligase II [Herbihabitans rhizosphaerae]|uniref:Acyl-CoA synthetase (AMP-forming)/AMP-acid ligase II n=1 Tax=Herbihabitans rhizosphaerae TaxID=1872711 RepID=A0A4Q7L7V2_9PSEU|nr:AMP-binding protein [Herbihabitans rhizosphaerae]RZS44721.1 acyl-CoA synthetase (AMP-forming)/AMP-acid ligase II [Herbihabitans rhizosphaerae]
MTTTELLADWAEKWAAATPDVVAIDYQGTRWTWSRWSDRIRRAAGGLRAAGIGRGDRIAFLDKNHPACLELTFAAASIGAGIAILNWRLAADELSYAYTDSGAHMLFAGPDLASAAVTATGAEHVVVIDDEYERFLADATPTPPAPDVEPADTALVIYSSGTTGRPKGVVLSQHALVTHTIDVGTVFPFADGDKNLVAMPLFHVGGICYAFFGIRAGVPSLMTREPDAQSLVKALLAGATHAFFVPPVITGFLAAGDAAIGALAKLRSLGYGAAPMPLPVLRRALDAWPDLNFVQVFGQTELAGVATSLAPADHRDPTRAHLLLSAGKPVPNVEVRVVDIVTEEDAPTGEQGEIWIRTVHRMTEYLNKPDATAETVTPDDWVRTGDVGHLDAEGYLYVEDRLKDMIITGGENVYGPEVERVLADHPHVTDAAIIGVPDERWGESVKAIVSTDGAVTAEDIIAFCRERLAGYKCPRTMDIVDALPRNASGKILKRDLRAPYWKDHQRAI